MKRTIVFSLLGVVVAVPHALSQGHVWFNNYWSDSPPAPVTINSGTGTYNPANGPPGAWVGSDYTASLFFLNSVTTNQTTFDSSEPILFSPANTPFYGTTGFNASDGSGFFDAGDAYLYTATSMTVTIEVRVWYNGGGVYTSYAQALAAGQNVGESNPVAVFLAQGAPPPTPLNGLLPFTVGIVPEPSTFGLFGLGGLSLWLFQRRK